MKTRPNFFPAIAALPEWEESEETLLASDVQDGFAIVIYNDDVNTFDWVIRCLMQLCGHDRYQAEQCAWFIHNNGKYAVKHGGFDQLKPICEALCDRGLSATIEETV
jgi:ATP-dependent Clp protease adaptor protein ClpS